MIPSQLDSIAIRRPVLVSVDSFNELDLYVF